MVDRDSSPALEEALRSDDVLLVRRPLAPVVIGCPHHAPVGVAHLYPSRVADENAGRFALLVADDLVARAVVACRATTHDPNKVDGPYLRAVLDPEPRALVEIHGHRGRRGRSGEGRAAHDVEVSTGAEEAQADALAFVGHLERHRRRWSRREAAVGGVLPASPGRDRIRDLTISGAWQEIHWQATGTLSLRRARERGLCALHVELPPALRRMRAGEGLPEAGVVFSALVAAALADLLGIDATSPRVAALRAGGRGDAPSAEP